MSAAGDGVATAARDGDVGLAVEAGVDGSEDGSRAYLVTAIFGAGDLVEEADVEDDAVGVVDDEVLVAVASGADGGAHACVEGVLEGVGCVLGAFADFDAGDGVGVGSGEAGVFSAAENGVAGVLLRHR